jgi:hypothetical protein
LRDIDAGQSPRVFVDIGGVCPIAMGVLTGRDAHFSRLSSSVRPEGSSGNGVKEISMRNAVEERAMVGRRGRQRGF